MYYIFISMNIDGYGENKQHYTLTVNVLFRVIQMIKSSLTCFYMSKMTCVKVKTFQ